jgi:O-antigen biosynthesis protein WbqP
VKILKRFFDFIFASFLLIVLLPIIIVLCLVVIFNSGRPALFVQRRVGKQRKEFWCYKIRTMAVNTGDVPSHMVGKTAITGIGIFLRKYKLDEFPQLVNVLKGEMSFVGPRPCLPQQKTLIDEREKRGVFQLSPGITGLAQIKNIDMSDPLVLAIQDEVYLHSHSFALDLKILLATLLGRGLNSDAASNVQYKDRP